MVRIAIIMALTLTLTACRSTKETKCDAYTQSTK
jgi:hypothetical protein